MADPVIDLPKLKVVLEWFDGMIDEITENEMILPCKNAERLGSCISQQRRYLVEEMKPSKMCERCKARWHGMMMVSIIKRVYAAKTEKEVAKPLVF